MSKVTAILTDQPIAYHPILAKVVGGVKAALFLSQLFYWTPRAKDENGWIYKSANEFYEETGMTRKEQNTARDTLIALNVIQYELKGMPAIGNYKVNYEVLESLLPDGAIQFNPKGETSFTQTAKQVSTKRRNTNKNTENTSETTTENTTDSATPLPDLSIVSVFDGEYLLQQIKIANDARGRRSPSNFANPQQRDQFQAALTKLNGNGRALIVKGIAQRGTGLSSLGAWLEACAKNEGRPRFQPKSGGLTLLEAIQLDEQERAANGE